jgi:integrase
MNIKIVREGPVKITRLKIEKAWRSRAKNQRLVVTDLESRGLALAVNPTSMSWRYDYKPRGFLDPNTKKRFSSRSITIGSPESHSPDEARAIANKHKGEAKAGSDPAAERKKKIAADAEKRANTMNVLLKEYAKWLPTRPKMTPEGGKLSARQVNSELAYVSAAISIMNAGVKSANEITDDNIKNMLEKWGTQAATARHYYGALSRFFDWARKKKFVSGNPCLLLSKKERPGKPADREDYLTTKELALLWKAAEHAEGLEPVHSDIVQFLICIPCRRGEAATLDWSHLDLDDSLWSQPGRLTKNREAHRLFLHPLALEILNRRHEAADHPTKGLVFPAPRSSKPLDTFSNIKKNLEEATPGLGDWRFHDFRRSFVTTLGEAGVSETVVDAMINHKQSQTRSGVLGVYQKAKRWPEQRRAMKTWGGALASAIDGKTQTEDKKVVSLKRRQG